VLCNGLLCYWSRQKMAGRAWHRPIRPTIGFDVLHARFTLTTHTHHPRRPSREEDEEATTTTNDKQQQFSRKESKRRTYPAQRKQVDVLQTAVKLRLAWTTINTTIST
jgi:hypothetical protein